MDNEEETKTEDGIVIVDMDKQRREAAIREKLEKSRRERERLALQNLEGKGLGDLLTEETKELDVKQWVCFPQNVLNCSLKVAKGSKKRR